MAEKQLLPVVTGPTASGKNRLRRVFGPKNGRRGDFGGFHAGLSGHGDSFRRADDGGTAGDSPPYDWGRAANTALFRVDLPGTGGRMHSGRGQSGKAAHIMRGYGAVYRRADPAHELFTAGRRGTAAGASRHSGRTRGPTAAAPDAGRMRPGKRGAAASQRPAPGGAGHRGVSADGNFSDRATTGGIMPGRGTMTSRFSPWNGPETRCTPALIGEWKRC